MDKSHRKVLHPSKNRVKSQEGTTSTSCSTSDSKAVCSLGESGTPIDTGKLNHPVAGEEPEKCYLDVIPEDKVLYDMESRRKVTKRKFEILSSSLPTQTPHSRTASNESGILMSEHSDDSDEIGDTSEEDNRPQPTHPFTQQYPVKRRKRHLSSGSIITQIDELMKDFRLTDETYQDIMKLLDSETHKGLRKETHSEATVKMYPTYVRLLPDGTEYGRYLALDLGGTNFRVLLVELRGKDEPKVSSKIFLIPKRIMLGPAKCLFDHIANCMHEFLENESLLNTPEKILLGFTFSFPCRQLGLAAAQLVRWTKGFKCSGMQNNDVVDLLHQAIHRKGIMNVECAAIINDPVGALVAGSHEHPNCYIGLILGTGTNCCYMENLDRVETWTGDRNHPNQVIINTEWGAFGEDGTLNFIRNVFDRELDRCSLNPGYQQFEKMISGLYMGEIVRLILCELITAGLLFNGLHCEELFTLNAFLTKYISEIESDDPESDFPNTKLVLQELNVPNFSLDDCRYVQHICWQVSQRAAFLAATAVATVIRHLDLPTVTVAVDGSLYRFHPHFKDLMNKKITQLIKPDQQFQLVLSHDGSGKGAALVVAVANRPSQSIQEEQLESE